MRSILVLLAAVLWLAAPAAAGTTAKPPKPPKAGRVTQIDCQLAADQSYALYVPKTYTPDRAWPILYCFAPNADGEDMVKRFVPVAEKLGWIVAGSLTSKNGPSEPNDRAWREILRDTDARLRLHGKKRVACGFSGASWVASRMAYGRPALFAGVILLGQGLDPTITVERWHAVAMIMGDKERRLHELRDVESMCARSSIPGLFETFPGGHCIAPDEWLAKALRWHNDTWDQRYEGCDDASVAHTRGALERQLKAAEELAAARKPAHAIEGLYRARDGFEAMTVARRRDLAARIAELEKTPEVAAELKARADLLKLVARERKLKRKHRKSLVKKYEQLANSYPATPSADIATELASLLGKD